MKQSSTSKFVIKMRQMPKQLDVLAQETLLVLVLQSCYYGATSAAEFLATLTQVPEFSFWRGPADVIEFFLTTIFHLDGLSPKEKSLLNGIAVSQHPSFGLIQELPLRVSKNCCSYSSCRRTQFSS